MSAPKTTEVATIPISDYAIITATDEDRAILNEAMAPGEELSFSNLPTIKIPTGGAKNWELPDGTATQEIEAILLHRQPVRAYWSIRFSEGGGGAPPDCSSLDNITGLGNNGTKVGWNIEESYTPDGVAFYTGEHDCATCPLSQYGTATNDKGEPAAGKACRQITRLFLMFPDSILPTLLPLPPSSYKEAQNYTISSAARGKRYSEIVTGIALEQDKSKAGITYSKALFRAIGNLSPDEAAKIRSYRADLLPRLTNAPIIHDEVGSD